MALLQEIFIQNFKMQRRLLGYSQAKLAELCDLSSGYIAEIEMGRKFPSLKTLENLSSVLKIKPYQLFLNQSDREVFNKQDLLRQLERELKNELPQAVAKVISRYS